MNVKKSEYDELSEYRTRYKNSLKIIEQLEKKNDELEDRVSNLEQQLEDKTKHYVDKMDVLNQNMDVIKEELKQSKLPPIDTTSRPETPQWKKDWDDVCELISKMKLSPLKSDKRFLETFVRSLQGQLSRNFEPGRVEFASLSKAQRGALDRAIYSHRNDDWSPGSPRWSSYKSRNKKNKKNKVTVLKTEIEKLKIENEKLWEKAYEVKTSKR